MSGQVLRVKDCSGYRPVCKACARMSGKPGPVLSRGYALIMLLVFLFIFPSSALSSYVQKCSLANGTVNLGTTEELYHYTLYYYDQADNLIRTVPPEGVNLLSQADVQNVQNARAANSNFVYPTHRLTTDYAYNSTNQVVQQHSPDGGTNSFWYDILSRLTVSQNDKQSPNNNYSYTTYDVLGRINEVGQEQTTAMLPAVSLTDNNGNAFSIPDYVDNPAALNTFLTGGRNSQITHTYYDDIARGYGIPAVAQGNLRKRVSASTYRENGTDPTVQQATLYNYDIDGNVKTLYQQVAGLYQPTQYATNGALIAGAQGLKQIDYEYDLVSGKVNFVRYQDGKPDQFYYRYDYDADNRLTDAWSGTIALVDLDNGSALLNFNQQLDAHYDYYLHGPLARMELGDVNGKVQGMDYAYTLQGWLKGVNSTNLNPATDMGNDGLAGANNSTIARDVYGYALHYYNGDYKPIGLVNPFADPSGNTNIGFNSLYNGNIAASTVNLTIPLSGTPGLPILYVYGYDQLNRLTRQDAYNGLNTATNTWAPVAINPNSNGKGDYHEDVTYDASGNIKTYNRNGFTLNGSNAMDALTYGYNTVGGNLVNNKLRFINDGVATSNYGGVDLQNQGNTLGQLTGADNYQYDPIGNLIVDVQSGITNIDWSVYGKIKAITKTNNVNNVSYTYDAAGHRVTKTVNGLTTYYVLDAQGNTLALYDNANSTTNWREQHLYGSSRLGMWMPNVDLNSATVASDVNTAWNTTGNKHVEITDWRGNVMATITNQYLQVPNATNTLIDHFAADVSTASDYGPFGMLTVGRQFLAGAPTRFGLNGHENDNEVNGVGNWINYGMRIYDPRKGRFDSVDPLAQSYPWYTPYAFSGNTPIQAVDLDGGEPKYMIDFYNNHRSIAFTRGDLFYGGFKNSVDGFQSKTDILRFSQILGKIYEDVALRSMNKTANRNRFYPDSRNRKSYFVPDAVQDGSFVLTVASLSRVFSVIKTFPNSVITEIKSTGTVKFDPEYNKEQFTKIIDFLSNVTNSDGEKATDYGAAALMIVAPALTNVDPEIVKYATGKRVRLYLSWTTKDPNDPNKVKVSNTAVALNDVQPNFTGSGAVQNATPPITTNDTQEKKIDWTVGSKPPQ